jgi:DNA-binding winged helix-turn-helix (wHTH) protein/TolB-like protein
MDDARRETVQRLAPQPAQLLLLLIDHYPGIVSHGEIREAIWPDVQVDYERSLHYCIRQIRSALDEQASDPQFIETIPRRGYRWMVDVERAADNTHGDVNDKTEKTWPAGVSVLSSSGWSRVVIGACLLLLLVFALSRRSSFSEGFSDRTRPLRLAVMPFQPADETSVFAHNDIALQLVEKLSNQETETFQVIGPTSTSNYSPDRLRDLIREMQIDYVINGRFSQTQDTSRLLAEIIRAGDGAHVWVRYFDDAHANSAIADWITTGFIQVLDEIEERQ